MSPELAERCRKAFTNNTVILKSRDNSQLGLLEESETPELPVIMMLMEVTANAGQKIGTLIDLASDTSYITHKAAKQIEPEE